MKKHVLSIALLLSAYAQATVRLDIAVRHNSNGFQEEVLVDNANGQFEVTRNGLLLQGKLRSENDDKSLVIESELYAQNDTGEFELVSQPVVFLGGEQAEKTATVTIEKKDEKNNTEEFLSVQIRATEEPEESN